MQEKKKVGGFRPGSGRPKGSGKYKEATCPIRIPNSLLSNVRDLLSQYEGKLSIGTELSNQLTNQGLSSQNSLSPEFYPQGFDNVYIAPIQPNKRSCPLYATRVAAGFPSPADDYIESKLDLNQYLVKHPAATFFVRVEGESMIGAGIHPDDILVVDRSLKPSDGKIVIAVVNGELTVKRLKIASNGVILQAENERFAPIRITEEMNFSIWGVVTSVVHQV